MISSWIRDSVKETVSQFDAGNWILNGAQLLFVVICIWKVLGIKLFCWVLPAIGWSPADWPMIDMGLLQYCGKGISTSSQICRFLALLHQDPYFKTILRDAVIPCIIGLILIKIHHRRVCIPVSCIIKTAAGMLLFAALTSYAAQAPDVVKSPSFPFFLLTISGAIFLINELVSCKSNNVEPEVGP